jgi:putative resolvase
MKLSEWARQNGLTYKTAWKLFKAGKLPVPAIQLSTGTVLLDPPKPDGRGVALYARVSSSDQKTDLDRQIARLVAFATSHKLSVSTAVSEIGSGLNGKRSKLVALLRDPHLGTIVVEHRERLARFGVEYLEAALTAQNRRILVVQACEVDDDLVRDMTEVLTSFCARLYGRRSARHRAERALKATQSA